MNDQKNNSSNSLKQGYEISLLDILVILAENIKIIIIIPAITGIIALGITMLIKPEYESISWLLLDEKAVPSMNSHEIRTEVINKTGLYKNYNLEEALKKIKKDIYVSFNKKDNYISIISHGPSPEQAQKLNLTLIDEYRKYSIPKGNKLLTITNSIDTLSKELVVLCEGQKKIAVNIGAVVPGTEGDNVARAFISLASSISTKSQLLYENELSLKGFGDEIYIQSPTLPIKPETPKKMQIFILTLICSALLTILIVYIRTYIRNLKTNNEISEKLVKINRALRVF